MRIPFLHTAREVIPIVPMVFHVLHHLYYMVGGFHQSEKYESQWEGWHPIYEMENKTCSKPPTSGTYLNFQTFNCWIPPSWSNPNLWWIPVIVIGPPHPNIMALITMVPWNLWPAPLNLVTFVDVKNRQTPRSILRTSHNTCTYIYMYVYIYICINTYMYKYIYV